MPGTSGPALLADLRKGSVGLRTLLMSGYTDDALSKYAESPLLQKPFTVAELAGQVRLALDRP
jgi:FixJ family two-component response regulator